MEMVVIALAALFFVGMGTGFLPAFWSAFCASARESYIASRQASEQAARELRAQLGKKED